MRISKERLDSLKKSIRARRDGAKGAAKGAKGSALAVGTGAASQYLFAYISQQSSFMRSNWYVTPAAMAVAGHFLKRKNYDAGAALLGAAGFAGATAHQASRFAPSPAPASGWDDAGALVDASAYGELEAGSVRDTAATSDTHPNYEAGALVDEATGPYDDATGPYDDATEAMGLGS
jgi:hypothetical protein